MFGLALSARTQGHRLRARHHRRRQHRRPRRDRAAVHHPPDGRGRARHARLHAARTGRPQHLHPRRLLRLPLADDPHAARRGRALRPLLARGRIEIRPSDAVGLEAHRARISRASAANIPTNGTSRTSTIRATWCRESVMPAYRWLLRERRCGSMISAQHLKALRAVGVPYTDEMIANATSRRLRPGRARHADSPRA